jgi:signal peptidase I
VSPGSKRGKSEPKSLGATVLELVVIVAVALLLALGIQAFVVKPYRIPSGSMEPTLAIGQRVLVDRLGNSLTEPHVGEIAVFHPPEGAEQEMCGPVPHMVTLGGDTISIVEGHVIRNGVREQDSYIRPCAQASSPECNFPKPIKIPAGHWFMMGDNRGESDDSRFWGPVPRSWIIGGAFATYWPISRIGTL